MLFIFNRWQTSFLQLLTIFSEELLFSFTGLQTSFLLQLASFVRNCFLFLAAVNFLWRTVFQFYWLKNFILVVTDKNFVRNYNPILVADKLPSCGSWQDFWEELPSVSSSWQIYILLWSGKTLFNSVCFTARPWTSR